MGAYSQKTGGGNIIKEKWGRLLFLTLGSDSISVRSNIFQANLVFFGGRVIRSSEEYSAIFWKFTKA